MSSIPLIFFVIACTNIKKDPESQQLAKEISLEIGSEIGSQSNSKNLTSKDLVATSKSYSKYPTAESTNTQAARC